MKPLLDITHRQNLILSEYMKYLSVPWSNYDEQKEADKYGFIYEKEKS